MKKKVGEVAELVAKAESQSNEMTHDRGEKVDNRLVIVNQIARAQMKKTSAMKTVRWCSTIRSLRMKMERQARRKKVVKMI